jgi:hypothetical protein
MDLKTLLFCGHSAGSLDFQGLAAGRAQLSTKLSTENRGQAQNGVKSNT